MGGNGSRPPVGSDKKDKDCETRIKDENSSEELVDARKQDKQSMTDEK